MDDDDRIHQHRITFVVDDELFERAGKIPFRARSWLLRILLTKVLDAAESQGNVIYAAIIEGEYELRYTGGDK